MEWFSWLEFYFALTLVVVALATSLGDKDSIRSITIVLASWFTSNYIKGGDPWVPAEMAPHDALYLGFVWVVWFWVSQHWLLLMLVWVFLAQVFLHVIQGLFEPFTPMRYAEIINVLYAVPALPAIAIASVREFRKRRNLEANEG